MARAVDRGEDELITSINVTPLVDIVLVLLIVLLVAVAYVVTNAIPLDLPPSVRDGRRAPAQIVVSIDAADRMRLDGEPVTAALLRERAHAFSTREPEGRGVIVADPSSSHGAFVRAVDALRQAGVRRYAVAAESIRGSDPSRASRRSRDPRRSGTRDRAARRSDPSRDP